MTSVVVCWSSCAILFENEDLSVNIPDLEAYSNYFNFIIYFCKHYPQPIEMSEKQHSVKNNRRLSYL